MSDENEWKKAPTEEKVEHKVSVLKTLLFAELNLVFTFNLLFHSILELESSSRRLRRML